MKQKPIIKRKFLVIDKDNNIWWILKPKNLSEPEFFKCIEEQLYR